MEREKQINFRENKHGKVLPPNAQSPSSKKPTCRFFKTFSPRGKKKNIYKKNILWNFDYKFYEANKGIKKHKVNGYEKNVYKMFLLSPHLHFLFLTKSYQ